MSKKGLICHPRKRLWRLLGRLHGRFKVDKDGNVSEECISNIGINKFLEEITAIFDGRRAFNFEEKAAQICRFDKRHGNGFFYLSYSQNWINQQFTDIEHWYQPGLKLFGKR